MSESEDRGEEIDFAEVMRRIPHRFPLLLVDRAEHYLAHTSITGIKNVTHNEPFFQGHFPGHPVMPGVLIIEAMAQASGLLITLSGHESKGPVVFYLVKVDKARFNQPVVPGDQLRLEVEHKRSVRNMSQFQGRALVGDTLVAEAEILCAEVPA